MIKALFRAILHPTRTRRWAREGFWLGNRRRAQHRVERPAFFEGFSKTTRSNGIATNRSSRRSIPTAQRTRRPVHTRRRKLFVISVPRVDEARVREELDIPSVLA